MTVSPSASDGGHQDVLGAAHGHLREDHFSALQTSGGNGGDDIAALDLDLGTHGLQGLQMQIHRAGADGAAAGQGHLGIAEAGQQRTQHQHRGAHLAHQIIGRGGIGDIGRRQLQHPTGMAAIGSLTVERQHDAVLGQQIGHGGDIHQMRQIGQAQGLVGQQTGGHEGQGGVLGPADGNDAPQRGAADDADLVHEKCLS